MRGLAKISIGHPFLVVLTAVGITVLSLGQIVDLRTGQSLLLLDSSFDALLPADSPGKRFYDTVVRRFGQDDSVLVVLVDDDIFRAEVLERVRRMTERFQRLTDLRTVTSLATAPNIESDGDDLSIEPFLSGEIPTSPAALGALRESALNDPIYAGNLVSRDGRATALILQPLQMSEQEFIDSGLDQRIQEIAREEAGPSEFLITGGFHIKAEMSRVLLSDLTRVIPMALVLMMGVAWAAFRSVRGVALSLATVVIAILWTLGLIGLLVGSLNQVTVAVPPILIVVGFAYAIHIVSAYYDVLHEGRLNPERPSTWDPAAEALSRVALPVLLTGVTTAAGFASLATSRLAAIREFGLFTGSGVLITTLISLTFAPAVLRLLGPPARSPRRGDAAEGDGLDRFMRKLGIFDVENRARVFVASGLVAVVAAIGMSRIEINTDFVRNFRPENPARLDFERVNDLLEGSSAFYVVIEAEHSDALVEPSNLEEIEALQAWLEAQPEIGGTTSLVDYLKAINRGFNGGSYESHAIPNSSTLVSQLFLFGANDELRDFVDSRYQSAKIAVRTSSIDTRDLSVLVDRIESRLAELPSRLDAQVTGNTVMVSRTLDEIALGQALSLITAFLIIYAILSGLFMSLRVGLMALVPNALPVLVYFGILGWSGISLNVTTGLVASMVLGIAVDDTIHFLTHFNRAAKARASEREGAIEALQFVGRPVTFTTAALCIGFATLTLSELQNQIQFGLLASSTLAVAWLVDVTLTPALAAGLRVVTLWEVLTLDLGREPQHSIPLFNGLSHTQARIVALMTQLERHAKGHRLIRKGEAGNSMYVVIEGTLRASVESDDGPVVLRDLNRGDVIGEVALFEGRRTANVDALTDVRLLCLTQKNLDRLRRRYSRAGAIFYRNLAGVLAGRLSNVTERVGKS